VVLLMAQALQVLLPLLLQLHASLLLWVKVWLSRCM
jgi:hypothetical protein